MDEASRFSLPLFPLHTVLYPGLELPLFIFEPRYQAMIKRCLAEESSFGVVLIEDGPEVGGPAEPYAIGTLARIVQVQRQAEGQMQIWVVGEGRFKIWEYSVSADDYLIGVVSRLVDSESDPLTLTEEIHQLKQLLRTYLGLTAELQESEMAEIEASLAPEPDQLSYQIASILDIHLVEKQALLELDDARIRLEREIKILQREIELAQLNSVGRSGPKTYRLPWGSEVNLN
jgi:hypothetical protein